MRDLCWALSLAENSILAGLFAIDAPDVNHFSQLTCSVLFPDLEARLRELDQAPATLHSWVQQRCVGEHGHYVGKYFEVLVSFALHHLMASDCSVLLENFEILQEEGGRPIGEVDILLHGNLTSASGLTTSGIHHVELAVKFYLISAETCGISNWEELVSPAGRSDTFALKYAKMRDVQVRTSRVSPLRQRLPEDSLGWIWMQGRVFRHFHVFQRPLGLHLTPGRAGPWQCRGISLHCSMGWWCFEDELAECFDGLDDASRFGFLIVKKPFWLAPLAAGSRLRPDFGPLLSASDVVRKVGREGPVVLLAVLVYTAPIVWLEVHRGFFVPRSWLDSADAPPVPTEHGPTWLARAMRRG